MDLPSNDNMSFSAIFGNKHACDLQSGAEQNIIVGCKWAPESQDVHAYSKEIILTNKCMKDDRYRYIKLYIIVLC